MNTKIHIWFLILLCHIKTIYNKFILSNHRTKINIKTFFILLDQKSSYSKGAVLSLTDGINPPIAKGEVLNGTSRQNVVEIKVLEGNWFLFNQENQEEYFIQSSNFFDTSGTQVVTLTSLSDNLEPFEVNPSVALIETSTNHGLGIGDKVTVDIFPDDLTKTKTYYLKKRLYQEVTFKTPSYSSFIEDTGIGRFQILNGGFDYTPGTYQNVLSNRCSLCDGSCTYCF